MTDASGSLYHLSPEWTKLTGQELVDAAGLGWLSCLHRDDQEIVKGLYAQAAASVSEFSVRFRLHFANGSTRWIGAGGVPSFGPPDHTFIGYLGSMIELAPKSSDTMRAYGSIGRYLPPPTHSATMSEDNLDQIADHLIIAHSLMELDGGKPALPALRQAMFEVGRALARKIQPKSKPN
ncbi:PAS domain-containing protein [Methylobacterium brachiatum]|uniref:PAS domain-containing protein n=1 Tax=Methylobacterium brachiatum TaxID=269660 RepID=UPI0013CEF4B5|nr:PAS domain-containing protein [Methylobacterium brachiatum]